MLTLLFGVCEPIGSHIVNAPVHTPRPYRFMRCEPIGSDTPILVKPEVLDRQR
jgi:hypothetical protein